MQLPPIHVESEFHQESLIPTSLHYVVSNWTVPALPAMMSKVDAIECYSVAELSAYSRNAQELIPGQGAKGRGDPTYRNEVYTTSNQGRARIASFTPNEVTVELDDASPDDKLVMNQNYYAGWTTNGRRVENYKDTIATS